MIALIVYKGNRPRMRQAFDLWHDFYKKSGTTMEFRIFCDHSCPWTCIGDIPLTRISARPPCPIENLSYGDWLRSELYNIVQKPLIYMDLDCLILESIDDTYFEFNGDLGMAYGTISKKGFNSGLIVFKNDFSTAYQKKFKNNIHEFSQKNHTYGQSIWSELNKEVGCTIPIEHHCTWLDIHQGGSPPKLKILHFHGNLANVFIDVAKILKNKI